MKNVLKLLAVGIFALLVFSMPALADDTSYHPGARMGMGGRMMGQGSGRMGNKMDPAAMFYYKTRLIMENADELGLSPDQIEQVRMLKMKVKKNQIKNNADVELLAIDIKEELKKDQINVNKINAMIDKKYGVKAREAKTVVRACADLKNILNKNQTAKLREIWNKQMAKEGKCMMSEKKSMMPQGQKMREGGMMMRKEGRDSY
ncbi:MAG: hypothetical protein PHQ84_05230 [Candidatus Omnitrophica bacterium]|jgi:hypothetical protein|nr:hypothetical protein [Candidatus Omnitrophota bacterium]